MSITQYIKVWILIGVYLFELSAPLMPFVDYFLHKKYIEENLCINRDKPELNCHGTCHLKKELYLIYQAEKPVKDEKKQSLPSFEIKIYSLRLCDVEDRIPLKDSLDFKKLEVDYQNFYTFIFSSEIFEPPPYFI